MGFKVNENKDLSILGWESRGGRLGGLTDVDKILQSSATLWFNTVRCAIMLIGLLQPLATGFNPIYDWKSMTGTFRNSRMIYLPFRVVVIMTIASAGGDKIRENVLVADNRLRVSSELRSRKSKRNGFGWNGMTLVEMAWLSIEHHYHTVCTTDDRSPCHKKRFELGKHLTVPILAGHHSEATAGRHKKWRFVGVDIGSLQSPHGYV